MLVARQANRSARAEMRDYYIVFSQMCARARARRIAFECAAVSWLLASCKPAKGRRHLNDLNDDDDVKKRRRAHARANSSPHHASLGRASRRIPTGSVTAASSCTAAATEPAATLAAAPARSPN